MAASSTPFSVEGSPIVGRDDELTSLDRFLTGPFVCPTLVLTGGPGLGKTTLWEAGLNLAADAGFTVLSTRASEAEASLSFAAMADLMECADPDLVARLPGPQARALDIALRRVDPAGAPPEPYAIAAGFLTALRALAVEGPLLIAVDDCPWLDSSSADALNFAARRLVGPRARLLLSRRSERSSGLESAVENRGLSYLEMSPLSIGAIGRLLSQRIGLDLPRRLLRQIYESAQGNPLWAMEIGRLVQAEGRPEAGRELPLPALADDLFGARVRSLPDEVRRILLAKALSPSVSSTELTTLAGPGPVADALATGLLMPTRSGFRLSHPMVGAALRTAATSARTYEVHAELAVVVQDPVLRALHLALASPLPDAEAAAAVADAVDLAIDRGAMQDAEELAAHAYRLTPVGASSNLDRMMLLANCHYMAGDMTAVKALLADRLADLPAGRARGEAYLLLGEGASIDFEDRYLDLAFLEAARDPELQVRIYCRRSVMLSVNWVKQIPEAERLVERAAAIAGPHDPRVRHARSWVRILRGAPIDDLVEPSGFSVAGLSVYESSVDRAVAIRHAFRGDIHQARRHLQMLRDLSEDRGEVRSVLVMLVQLCELELRAGYVRGALDILAETKDWSVGIDTNGVRRRLTTMAAAVAGDPLDQVEPDEEGDASHTSWGWDALEERRAVGLAYLFEGDTARACEELLAVWEHNRLNGVTEPGAFPVAGDLVEALVAEGRYREADDVIGWLADLAEAQKHPWGLITLDRCRAIAATKRTHDGAAVETLLRAAQSYGDLDLAFDRARTLLLLGRMLRRFNKRAAARSALSEAAGYFDELGAAGWAEQARGELARLSGRRSDDQGSLTPSEKAVAELAAAGRSNKEIASQLFISVYTVEAHLSHAYAKLGVRSRSQLSAILSSTVTD